MHLLCLKVNIHLSTSKKQPQISALPETIATKPLEYGEIPPRTQIAVRRKGQREHNEGGRGPDGTTWPSPTPPSKKQKRLLNIHAGCQPRFGGNISLGEAQRTVRPGSPGCDHHRC